MWEITAASLHNDVFHDSEERHERAVNCAYAYDDPLVRSSRAPEVAKWQYTYLIEWDATDGEIE